MTDVEDVIAVTGEQLDLRLTGAEVTPGPVTVSFEFFDEEALIVRDFWSEKLTATAGPETDGLPTVLIPWRVNINGSFRMPPHPASISFTVNSVSGVKASNLLKIPAFKLTSEAKLRSIMLHEFAKQGARGFELNDEPLQKFVDDLTPQQRKLLATHKVGSAGNRLVVFITLQPQNALRMNADTCQTFAQSLRPNATFTVFHCQGPGKAVTLVCHTEHFVLNMLNPDTKRLVAAKPAFNAFRADLARDTVAPPMFKIGSYCTQVSHFLLWSRIFSSDLKDAMPGNMMHGMINTVGCWMLFRNYNWPRAKTDDFDRIYVTLTRQDAGRARELSALSALGYDAKKTDTLSSSGQKYINFDRNFSYLKFFRHVVGVRYFSQEMFERVMVHDLNSHGLVFEKQFENLQATLHASKEGDAGFIAHDGESRRKTDKTFTPSDALWEPNALGFKTSLGFVPDKLSPIPPEVFAEKTWADLFIYRADALPVSPVTPAFFAPTT